jgi:hypothetical protein
MESYLWNEKYSLHGYSETTKLSDGVEYFQRHFLFYIFFYAIELYINKK